jgi:Zn-dependent membrane protease YugP
MIGYYILIGIISLFSWLVSSKLKSKFEFYSKIQLRNGMSGKEIAEKMLADNGIRDVRVISVAGQLTDHYNPVNKTVNLSESVFNQRNASSAAVAAHECGHAVQHATAYSWLKMRSSLVPLVNVTSTMSQWVIIGGLILMAVSSFGIYVATVGLVLMAIATVFSFVTLPVEYDASNRACWSRGCFKMGSQNLFGCSIRSSSFVVVLGFSNFRRWRLVLKYEILKNPFHFIMERIFIFHIQFYIYN